MTNYKEILRQPVQTSSQCKKELAKNKKIEESYKKILATKEGRVVLWDLLCFAELYSDAFTGNSTTFYKLGLKRSGTRIIERINSSDPDAYAKLLLEIKDD